MGKSYRFDPDDDFGGDNLPTMSKKELKEQRNDRHKRDDALDQLDTPEDSSPRNDTFTNRY